VGATPHLARSVRREAGSNQQHRRRFPSAVFDSHMIPRVAELDAGSLLSG
jgi:hypothetical protein